MAAGPILHVGDDICHRIPVMESAGILVLRSEYSVGGVRASLGKGDCFSAVAFHNDLFAPSGDVVSTARKYSRAPLILFWNPFVECDERLFDIIMPVSSPDVWSKSLQEAIAESWAVQEVSRQLRQDCEATRNRSRVLLDISSRNRICPIDEDVIFRAGPDGRFGEPDGDDS